MSEVDYEPLSWLALERYALGELTASERVQVEQRLAQSAQDRACLQSILLDDTVMPALPTPRLTSVMARSAQQTARQVRRSWTLSGGIFAAAAALAFALIDDDTMPRSRTVYDGTKGGEVAIALHGARQGGDARTFVEGDRFKLLVTCPDWLSGTLQVLIFQDGQRYRPLADGRDVACGNSVPWPGAFTLDGAAPVDVCVTWDADTGRRDEARVPDMLSPNIVCARLERR